jgi:hypothetical protein
VQNKFSPETKWDVPLRKFCKENNIIYQSFWTFTGNPTLMKTTAVITMAKEIAGLGIKKAECGVLALYCLVLGLGDVAILDEATDVEMIRGDVEDVKLVGVKLVGKWIEGDGKETWTHHLENFKRVIGDSCHCHPMWRVSKHV